MKKRNFSKVISVALAIMMLFSFSSVAVNADNDSGNAKNIILMIGDGMGENSIEWTKAVHNVELNVDTLPYKGYSKTASLTGVTDSAAGGTALSSGHHAINSNVGMLAIPLGDAHLDIATYMNTCEVAQKLGKKTGILTSDDNSGATPASFSAHVAARGYSEDITAQQLDSNIDLIWAKSNGLVSEERAENAGWEFVDELDDIDELEDNERSFAAFDKPIEYKQTEDDSLTLSVLTEKAIENLDNDKGFFLMVEGAHIDKNNHKNNSENMMKAMLEFDKAIGIALDFARNDGNTIVIITADHETGGIKKDKDGSFKYTSDGHTGANVPLRVYGADDLVGNGEAIVNTEVSRYTAKKLGYTEKYPVFVFNSDMLIDFFKSIILLIKK